MPSVLAYDYGGTLERNGRLYEPMVPALEAARMAGFAQVLVTCRSFVDLLRELPNALALFDRVVCENGAVLARAGGRATPLADPVDPTLDEALVRRGIESARGQVIVLLEASHEQAVREIVDELGLDVRLARDRETLMVVPVAISKAVGLSHALASLGVGYGETIAFGDAQSDREMLSVCALGVAVGDAVAELKMEAEVVLDEPGPEGVAKFVLGLAAATRPGLEPEEE
jgi:hydroxymethylpyrimidine pyrophosphatase-like HAD family hydrolase